MEIETEPGGHYNRTVENTKTAHLHRRRIRPEERCSNQTGRYFDYIIKKYPSSVRNKQQIL